MQFIYNVTMDRKQLIRTSSSTKITSSVNKI